MFKNTVVTFWRQIFTRDVYMYFKSSLGVNKKKVGSSILPFLPSLRLRKASLIRTVSHYIRNSWLEGRCVHLFYGFQDSVREECLLFAREGRLLC